MYRIILQSLLDAQVFTLPDNDDRLTQLEISVTQLAKKLQENVSDIPFYILVALDLLKTNKIRIDILQNQNIDLYLHL